MMLDLNNLPGEPEQLERNANRKFTAREDDGTGLYCYRSRYFQPALGRFLAEDPFDMVNGPNNYAYALNSPGNWVDPRGLDVFFNRGPQAGDHGWVVIGGNNPVPLDVCQSYGWYPGGALFGSPGEVYNPDYHANDSEIFYEQWATTPETEAALVQWIYDNFSVFNGGFEVNGGSNRNPNYNLVKENCGSWQRRVKGQLRKLLRDHGVPNPKINLGQVPLCSSGD
jgi:RHS repeat-associated protein